LALKFSITYHHSSSWSAILLQHCWQIGNISPFIWIYNLIFSLLQASFQGFLQCSIFFPRNQHFSVYAFKVKLETLLWLSGGEGESETLYVYDFNWFVAEKCLY